VLLVGIVAYWWVMREQNKKPLPAVVQTNKTPQQDIAPGGYKARLTLADGSTVTLNNSTNGEVTKQGSMAVVNKDGGLIYRSGDTKGNASDKEMVYNTLTTARGETYAITLSDGSRVWLNSESSVHYPVSFSGNERDVQVTGEAYFEVAHDASKPFIVSVKNVAIQVLGTKFNVNAYDDEDAIKTTLLEGKVKQRLTDATSQIILSPGEQAEYNKQNLQLTKSEDVDVDEAVAWRFGYFQFSHENVRTVLKQLSRWYDVDVKYQGNVPQRSFGGKISRSNSLSQVLKTLEANDLHFRLQGREIIVSP